jgi:hypothetical protein
MKDEKAKDSHPKRKRGDSGGSSGAASRSSQPPRTRTSRRSRTSWNRTTSPRQTQCCWHAQTGWPPCSARSRTARPRWPRRLLNQVSRGGICDEAISNKQRRKHRMLPFTMHAEPLSLLVLVTVVHNVKRQNLLIVGKNKPIAAFTRAPAVQPFGLCEREVAF